MKLSVIIPTIDEYGDIDRVVEGICETCSPEDIAEIKLIYPEFAEEKYVSHLGEVASSHPGFRIETICQPRPGIGAAVYDGFYSATGDYLTAIGADMENDPRDIAVMIAEAKAHPGEIITASRRLRKGDFSAYPAVKRIVNIAFQTLLRVIFSTKQSDITYMFQCTPRELLQKYDFSRSVNSFILALALLPEKYDIPFREIPSKVGRRGNGESHLKFRYYFGFLKEALRLFGE